MASGLARPSSVAVATVYRLPGGVARFGAYAATPLGSPLEPQPHARAVRPPERIERPIHVAIARIARSRADAARDVGRVLIEQIADVQVQKLIYSHIPTNIRAHTLY